MHIVTENREILVQTLLIFTTKVILNVLILNGLGYVSMMPVNIIFGFLHLST